MQNSIYLKSLEILSFTSLLALLFRDKALKIQGQPPPTEHERYQHPL